MSTGTYFSLLAPQSGYTGLFSGPINGSRKFEVTEIKMKLNIGIFQYEMQDEDPFEKINRLESHLNKNDKLYIGPSNGIWLEVVIKSFHNNFRESTCFRICIRINISSFFHLVMNLTSTLV